MYILFKRDVLYKDELPEILLATCETEHFQHVQFKAYQKLLRI